MKTYEIRKGYLSFSSFIIHAAFIGLGMAIIEIVYDLYTVLTSDLKLVHAVFSLVQLVSSPSYAIFSAVLVFPIYKLYSRKRGGLSVNTHLIPDSHKIEGN